MDQLEQTDDPEWETPLQVTLTPEEIMHTVFATAESVHTGWESCVDHRLVTVEMTALAEEAENYCRYVEQEYAEDDAPEVTFHDWTVELKIGLVYVSAHWRTAGPSPSDWFWCAKEAEKAFAAACILVGKRVRRGIVIEESVRPPRTPRMHH